MRVKVYFNLHKKLFSVVAMEGLNKGRVVKHVDEIEIARPTFKVSQAGRKRVLKEKRKNVHAYVVGWECKLKKGYSKTLTNSVTYNPYLHSSFVNRADNSAVSQYEPYCKLVVESNSGKIYTTSDSSYDDHGSWKYSDGE